MKFNEYWRKIFSIRESLEELVDELEEEQSAIDEKKYMTEIDEARYGEIYKEIDAIQKCMNNLNSAMHNIEGYRK